MKKPTVPSRQRRPREAQVVVLHKTHNYELTNHEPQKRPYGALPSFATTSRLPAPQGSRLTKSMIPEDAVLWNTSRPIPTSPADLNLGQGNTLQLAPIGSSPLPGIFALRLSPDSIFAIFPAPQSAPGPPAEVFSTPKEIGSKPSQANLC
ncbi:hypothetical protein BDZ45DRAFT_737088 [Acephala macrosclerotiorum]|nr:hypothetical protein BDZ45DRAFT_737088 [Acephala macrosclerotiorum]